MYNLKQAHIIPVDILINAIINLAWVLFKFNTIAYIVDIIFPCMKSLK